MPQMRTTRQPASQRCQALYAFDKTNYATASFQCLKTGRGFAIIHLIIHPNRFSGSAIVLPRKEIKNKNMGMHCRKEINLLLYIIKTGCCSCQNFTIRIQIFWCCILLVVYMPLNHIIFIYQLILAIKNICHCKM